MGIEEEHQPNIWSKRRSPTRNVAVDRNQLHDIWVSVPIQIGKVQTTVFSLDKS